MTLNYKVVPGGPLQGAIQIPGDKSISHRAVMLGAIAQGASTISGFLKGADCLATMAAFNAMGVNFTEPHPGEFIIEGVGLHGLHQPATAIDAGNSGTAMRLLTGLLAGQAFSSVLTGDDSLRRRPMSRVVKPLRQMGAVIDAIQDEYAPLMIHGGKNLQGIEYYSPISSAQVKSCLLLAGLYANGETIIKEPAMSRDHTERMLQEFGGKLAHEGTTIRLAGRQTLHATTINIPGDISSAAFFLVGATICPGSDILLTGVGVNPTRIGVISILRQMGADITLHNGRIISGEPVADIQVHYAKLRGIDIPQDLIPFAIDEFPIIFIAAACAQGVTRLRGAQELRVKESDRINSMASGLASLGIRVSEQSDGIIIQGAKIQGGRINSRGDHRVAMAFAIAGLVAEDPIIIEDCANVMTSFPNFVQLADELGFTIVVEEVVAK